MTSSEIDLPADYVELLDALRVRVTDARTRAQRTVNTLLIELYWSLGKDILARQDSQGWGSGVINRLANDLRASFPDMKGLSARNLQYMTAMVRSWGPEANVPQVVAHFCHGATSERFWTKRQPPKSGTGMPLRPSSTGGPGTS